MLAGFAAVQRGRLAEATALLEPALEGAAAGTARADRVTHWLAARALHVATSDHARLVPVLAALEDDPAFADLSPAARVEHHLSRAYAATFTGDPSAAFARTREAVALAGSGDDAAAEVLARHLSPLLIAHEGGMDLLTEHIARTERALADRDAAPTPLVRLGLLLQRACAGVLAARWDEARAAVAEAADLPERLGGLPYLRATLDWVEAAVAYARGDLALAEARCRPATATDLDRELTPLRRALLARILRLHGRTTELSGLALVASGHDTLTAAAAASVRAQAALATGDPAGAAEHLSRAPLLLAPFLVPSHLDRAIALAAAGRRQEAVASARDVVETARRWRMPGLLAFAGDEARPLLEEVGGPTVATALGALDVPAGPAPVPVPGGAEVLSGREVEVLRLLADGASNRAVAERLVRQREHRQDPRPAPADQARRGLARRGRRPRPAAPPDLTGHPWITTPLTPDRHSGRWAGRAATVN